MKSIIFLFALSCAYPEIAIAQTLTTFDMLAATETLTVGNLNSPHPLPVGNLNSFSFATAGISSFSAAGISLFTVPSGISQILVKAWGAGGAGGGQGNCEPSHAGSGAGGSFASGIIGVTPGEVLTIEVGAGGTGVLASGSAAGLPGGQGLSSTAGGSGGYGGSGSLGDLGNGGGGAASGVFLVTTSTVGLVVAGGGGAGGGLAGTDGPNGGSASAQGVGGADNANGTSGSTTSPGGGGGGGGATSGGTGGGAGLAGTTGNSVGAIIIYGSGIIAGNTGDVDYSTASPSQGYPNGNETVGVGTGGDGGVSTCFGQSGNSGAVVLYNVPVATATILGNLVVSGTVVAVNFAAPNLTVTGAVTFSTYTHTIIDISGATAAGIAATANRFTSCVAGGSTITWTADGVSTYTVIGYPNGIINSGSSPGTWMFGFLLDGAFPSGQSATKGLCSVYMTTAENRPCPFEGTVSPAAGSHSVCLFFGQTSYADTLTFGGTAAVKSAANFILRIDR